MTTVVQAMSAVMSEVRAVSKGERNTQQNFNFRGVDTTVNALGPAMRKHGVVVVPGLRSHELSPMPLSGGKIATRACVQVDYIFYGPDGDSITASVPGEAFDLGDKATAKAMSVAYRTALLQAFTLPTQETDPDEESYEAAMQEQGPNWEKLFAQAVGNRQALESLRAHGKRAGAPEGMFDAIAAKLASLDAASTKATTANTAPNIQAGLGQKPLKGAVQ